MSTAAQAQETPRTGRVLEVNGPLARLRLPQARNGEQVSIGPRHLTGEIIALQGEDALAQVYEDTSMLRPGTEVRALGWPLSVELGPGLIGGIFDGVQRPLTTIAARHGDQIPPGVNLPALDRERRWRFTPVAGLEPGVHIGPGMALGGVPETASIQHRILCPPDEGGELLELAPEGDYHVTDVIARVRGADGHIHKLRLFHRWPVRRPRPYATRLAAGAPLITGQRVLDTFFPLAKGGKGAIPGPFGAGKTLLQQQIARWSDASVVIYVGCGERGNELVDVLETFPKLTDPRSGRPLLERTLLVANTSNMPVVAREASIYVGITLAEYYRDQGLHVVMLADSTSRWAEALREVGGRLGHMPVEEGYPAYLSSRLAAFYERAGYVRTLEGSEGSVSLIGAVSPPGGDFSEPVTTHTKEVVQTFWALSKDLADARHYPAVDWNDSYSAHAAEAGHWWEANVGSGWAEARTQALGLLAREADLARIVNLVGPEALSSAQRWTLLAAGLIKDAVLQQSGLDPVDSYCAPARQFRLLGLMLLIHQLGADLIERGVPVQQLAVLPVLGRARRLKSQFGNEQLAALDAFEREVRAAFDSLRIEAEKAGGAP
jgi:V/A-type H+-transporting ATPase subunit A